MLDLSALGPASRPVIARAAHTAPMSLLDSWTRGEHTRSPAGVTHPTYRKGSGPGVIVIHEIPGMTPKVIGFGEEVVEAGFTVVMPHLFGTPERAMSPLAVAGTLRQVCVSREFTKLATGETSPVAGWLRSLARELHEELGGPGVGALGMCFTGGFALAMMVDDSVAAPVLAQPSAPFPVGQDPGSRTSTSPPPTSRWSRSGRPAAARCSACATARTRPSGSGSSGSPRRSATRSSASSSPGRGHSTVTEHRSQGAVDRVLAFFREKLQTV